MTKIDIFSGFLGAGKTTLIKKLISEAYTGEKLVLIENEFGQIGIDGGFLAEAGINITEMNSGCICCSLVGDFSQALAKVIDEYHPDRVLIEPSGVGKLSDVIRAVQNSALSGAVLNGITTVADAKKCKMYQKNFGEFYQNQILFAKTIVLSHTAGLAEDKLTECVDLLREIGAQATMITTDWDALSGAQMLEAIEGSHTLAHELEELLAQQEVCPVCGHAHGHDHDHDHDHDEHEHHHDHDEHEHHHDHDHEHHHDHDHHHHHADEVFDSWGVETARTFTEHEITEALKALSDERRFGAVLRAKGIVAAADGAFIHFDYVPGEPDVRYGAAAVTGRLCVIGAKLHEDALKELFGV